MLNAAKVRPKKTKTEILSLYPGYNGMVKKTISRYCPFKYRTVPCRTRMQEKNVAKNLQ
jgi:hypothetical protein